MRGGLGEGQGTERSAASTRPQPVALHGTYQDAWGTIAIKGLSRMKRNHIHLASGESLNNTADAGGVTPQSSHLEPRWSSDG